MAQWFKFYGSEFLSDTKIVPLNGAERICWITILCLASQTEDGVIKFISEDQLKAMSGILPGGEMWKTCSGILNKFAKLDMVTLGNGNVTVKNWTKRQLSESYLRVKRFREKRDSNVTETTEREIERKKEYPHKAVKGQEHRESPKINAEETKQRLKKLME